MTTGFRGLFAVASALALTIAPMVGHLVAMPCTNDLLIVDTFGNVQRLEQLIRSLDRGGPYTPGKCSAAELARATDKPREH